MKKLKILTINPGSTSTKIAIFLNDTAIFNTTIEHQSTELIKFDTVSGQLTYRKEMILKALDTENVDLNDLDAVVGRGGGLYAVEGGVYSIDKLLLEHTKIGINGVQHPAQLGAQLAAEFAAKHDVPAYIVNPPDTDEYQDVARITGVKGVYRHSHLHALNLKETAIHHAKNIGKPYNQCNFIVCHIGGGVSVSAHCQGKMVDGFDIVEGEGPMAPTRCGSLSVSNIVNCLEEKTTDEVMDLCTKSGGFVSHLGTSDAREVISKAESGDKYAKLIWDAMVYQIEKCIGSMAVVLKGKVDGILLSGGMIYSEILVKDIIDVCSFIAPITAYPGEFEMEAMAAGAIRVLEGLEESKIYSGVPNWTSKNYEFN